MAMTTTSTASVLCCTCRQNQDSMIMWLAHLVSCHPLPVTWLSDKAKVLHGEENSRPYTVVTDSRKRRLRLTHPRPLNTFMIFSRHIRRNILSVFPDASNSLVSKELGALWKTISHDVKTCYEEEAKRLLQLHSREFPDYKYQPKKRSRRLVSRPSIYGVMVSPTNMSPSSTAEEEEVDDEKDKDTRSVTSDIENHYVRYSVLKRGFVKEVRSFNSPLKEVQVKQECEVVSPIQVARSFGVRNSNYDDEPSLTNIFLRQSQRPGHPGPSSGHVYMAPQSHRQNQSHGVQIHTSSTSSLYHVQGGIQSLSTLSRAPLFLPIFKEETNEDDIDITSNIFSNEFELEWSDLDDNDNEGRHKPLSQHNSFFSH